MRGRCQVSGVRFRVSGFRANGNAVRCAAMRKRSPSLRPAPDASRGKCGGLRSFKEPARRQSGDWRSQGLLNVGAGFSLLPYGECCGAEVPAADRQFHVGDAVGCGGGIFDVDFASLAGQQGNVVVSVISGENARAVVSINESRVPNRYSRGVAQAPPTPAIILQGRKGSVDIVASRSVDRKPY
jgi:hypothetical protein